MRKVTLDHINYIVNQRNVRNIITGGAFLDEAIWIGFQIYNCKTKEEVIKITEVDPLIFSKMAFYEIHPWITLKGEVKFE